MGIFETVIRINVKFLNFRKFLNETKFLNKIRISQIYGYPIKKSVKNHGN